LDFLIGLVDVVTFLVTLIFSLGFFSALLVFGVSFLTATLMPVLISISLSFLVTYWLLGCIKKRAKIKHKKWGVNKNVS